MERKKNEAAGMNPPRPQKAADDALNAIMSRVKNPDRGKAGRSPMLTVKTANDWNYGAATRPDPERLWRSLWYEGEACCLFADSNLGKSVLAVQVGTEIARSRKVIYFDFEMSDKMFQLRYTDGNGRIYTFPDNFMRAEIDANGFSEGSFEDELIAAIEEAAVTHGAKVLIIDNLTWICASTEKGDVAGTLMIRLKQLSRRHGLSLLIVAHTPKRVMSSPITQNDLAGSKKLFNFFDSVVAIGQSAKDTSLRYIKQIKTRMGAFEHGADNVIVCELTKDCGFTKFVERGQAAEREHLSEPSENDNRVIYDNVSALLAEGKSVREIAAQLDISRSKAWRIVKKLNEKK